MADHTAWLAFLNPYTFVIPDKEEKWEISLDEINSNSYDKEKLSKPVATLPLTNTKRVNALVSYDGAIAIPKNADYPSTEIALDSINRIFCAILLGGIHAEVINSTELHIGSLMSKTNLFDFRPGLHSNLRLGWTSLQDRIILSNPRIICVSKLRDAYLNGIKVLTAINNLTPLFLLHGYTSMMYQNRSDALSSLWIVVEQLTWYLWNYCFLIAPELHPASMNARRKSLEGDNRTWSTAVKHELLWQTKFISEDCFAAISTARKSRNDLVHKGNIPDDFATIQNLWRGLLELIESASGIKPIGMRSLGYPAEFRGIRGFDENDNFDLWKELSQDLGN